MRNWRCITTIIIALPVSFSAIGQDQTNGAVKPTPPGFEALIESQRSLVDIYFGGRYLTSQMAAFRPGFIQLSNPDEIVQRIGDLSDAEQIYQQLSGELDSNASAVCLTSSSQNCGIIVPAVAGVIFDESRFRVDVFVNRRYMLTRAADVRKYLPPSDAGFAMMQNLSAAVSGSSSSGDDNYTVIGSTMASWQENALYMDWDYSNTNHFSVDQLYAQRDFEGLRYSGGLLRTDGFGFNFISDQPMVGLRINSSTSTRVDESFTSAAPIEVFLPTRGRVEIYRDGRLVTSSFFEAGAQLLNTSGLASGAYDIEIRILDDSGNLLSTETRFFTKQSQIPPIGEWLFFAESGRVMTRENDSALPDATDQWLSRAGVSRRLGDTMSATGAIAVDKDDALVELGFYHFGYGYEISQSAMLANDRSAGMALNGRLSLGDLGMYGSYRRLRRPDNFKVDNDIDNPRMLGNGFKQHSAGMNYPLFNGSLSYRYSLNQNDSNTNEPLDPTRTHSLSYSRRLFRAWDYDGDMTLSLSRSGDTDIAVASLVMRYRKDRWEFQARPQVQVTRVNNTTTDRSERARFSTTWRDQDLLAADLQVEAGVEVGSGDERLDGQIRYSNSFGRLNLGAVHTQGDRDSTTSWAGGMSTSFLTDGNVIAMGGERPAESALVVNMDARPGDVFDVNVNGRRQGYAVAGRSSVVTLPAFNEYRVSLRPSGDTLYNFDEREQNVTLYPGNVVTLDYQATPLQLLFGRLMFNGQSVENARVRGGIYPGGTDSFGMFQVESSADIKTLDVEMSNGMVCQLPIPTADDSYVVQLGTVELANGTCQPAQQDSSLLSQTDRGSR